MKIGILAYHAACNFGAFLQLLSTVEYIRNCGDEPLVINWMPSDFRDYYEKAALPEVLHLYKDLRQYYYPLTRLCETAQEVAETIKEDGIEAVIIGSDAVLQHHPFRERFYFPTRTVFTIGHPTSDRMYPNCFWGQFNDYIPESVPTAIISGSCQDSKYYYITGRTKKRMKSSILSFRYISVRDEWTQKMIEYLTDGAIVPEITPDPVFAFNYNAGHLLPNKEAILKRFNIPNDYYLLSFKGPQSVSQPWIDEFQSIANKQGIACVKLPYADKKAYGNIQFNVGNLISPLEWYTLIKFSKGYVGNNMHPIVTCIHNSVPFYSFDNYGIAKIDGVSTNGESSKIYHILKCAGLLEYRVFIKNADYISPAPSEVIGKLIAFKKDRAFDFAQNYYTEYKQMMSRVRMVIKEKYGEK